MDAASTVSAVIANFNGEHYLPGLLDALRATQFPFHEIIVSDDASTDGSRLLLRHRHPEVVVVAGDVNRGVACTRNRGIRRATGRYVLLLDNDAYPCPDAVEPLLAALEAHPEVVAVMPRVILDGDPPLVHCDGSRTHVTGQMWLVNGHVPEEEAGPEAQPISGLMGTAMMFRREAALAIGGFEESLYFYYEDHDFGTRMRILQGPLLSVPSARIRHLGGTKNLSFRAGRAYPRRRMFLTPRNRLSFTIRVLEARTLVLVAPVLVLQEAAQLLFALARGWLDPVLGAECWIVSHLAFLLRKREAIQRARVCRDRAILEDGPLPLHPGLLARGGLGARLVRLLEGAMALLLRPVRRRLLGASPEDAPRPAANRSGAEQAARGR